MSLDIDKLHDTISKLGIRGELGRRSGKTTAQFVLLIGELELGDDNTAHLVVAPTHSIANNLLHIFLHLLQEFEIGYRRDPKRPLDVRTIRNQLIKFVHFDDLPDRVRGMRFRTVTYEIPAMYIGVPSNLEPYIQSTLEDSINVSE
jgi:hypothetical protein